MNFLGLRLCIAPSWPDPSLLLHCTALQPGRDASCCLKLQDLLAGLDFTFPASPKIGGLASAGSLSPKRAIWCWNAEAAAAMAQEIKSDQEPCTAPAVGAMPATPTDAPDAAANYSPAMQGGSSRVLGASTSSQGEAGQGSLEQLHEEAAAGTANSSRYSRPGWLGPAGGSCAAWAAHLLPCGSNTAWATSLLLHGNHTAGLVPLPGNHTAAIVPLHGNYTGALIPLHGNYTAALFLLCTRSCRNQEHHQQQQSRGGRSRCPKGIQQQQWRCWWWRQCKLSCICCCRSRSNQQQWAAGGGAGSRAAKQSYWQVVGWHRRPDCLAYRPVPHGSLPLRPAGPSIC
jgi:hypothetical protein